jgi:hypothetical protein
MPSDLAHASLGAGAFGGSYVGCQFTTTTTPPGGTAMIATGAGSVMVADATGFDFRVDFLGTFFGASCTLGFDRDPAALDSFATAPAGQTCTMGATTLTLTSGSATHDSNNTLTLHLAATVTGGTLVDSTWTCH